MALPRTRRFLWAVFYTFSGILLLLYTFSDLISLSPCAFIYSQDNCYRGYLSEYSFDVDEALHPDWMKAISDDANITSLSIPGTHDTLTFDIRDELFQCQNNNLSAQLRAGMRYLDVRGRLVDDAIQIYHAEMFTGYSFVDVLTTVSAFLDAFPSEAIIMRLKEEGHPHGTNTITFEQAFLQHIKAEGQKHRFYAPPAKAFWPLPTLGTLRSGILLLQNFAAPQSGPHGLIWGSNDMILEDLWIIPSLEHLYMKWDAVEHALTSAADPANDDNAALYLAHLSATVGVLPIQAAAGGINGSVEGINDQTGRWLDRGSETGTGGRTGVVIIDFPGRALVDAVLARNKGLVARGLDFDL
ncbi:hypothetical protein VD0002_g8730 [Verticillium dahliae]|uniref:1-phosphatidylinositol phosphodiesterase n=2 Tax=Verticillium dahliae TaxID=27337 RepID=G2WQH2_VERDV|nr:1-phosphatidylinositol phosphodiesterase [Verticillium dahliae VdLs.17]KAF3350721.1 hypothetical protein VdG2_01185 [Verticillium dahliae VDG2]KAH6710407.1 1-phosphatidylinositol phosphodiesterase [Verticillium dahliae]EGY13932.1 1-phosphatidylinositol phosphodiesterase [Verticillium dahliae VdLs.17]PNH33297.1 hypothetical protein BJF96_g3428 [Verticillium dahliae]PNH51265.1 hypothetical protein VD0003_g5968 [Verticillium dahliae]